MSSADSNAQPAASPASPSSASSLLPGSPPPPKSLPSLGVEFPPDHPIARRQSQLAAQQAAQQIAAASGSASSGTPNKGEALQAHLLEQFSQPLTVPNSPAEITRRMSIGPSSRRNSILAIPPASTDLPIPTDHLPELGHDTEVAIEEIEKEIEEIDTIG